MARAQEIGGTARCAPAREMDFERGAGFFLPGELGVSPSFFKIPQEWGIRGLTKF